jgi:nucleoside-diphosphate-sugar epimerase
MQNTVLILGARGRLGLASVRAFSDAGWRVLAQVRPGAALPHVASERGQVQWLAMGLGDHAGIAAVAQGAGVVVHALNPAYTDRAWREQALPMLNVSIELARTLGARLMLPGNVYNFGRGMPQLLYEDAPQVSQTVKGKIRIAMEQRLQTAGVRNVVIRAGDFFGSGEGTWFDRSIVKDIQKGMFTYPGGRDVATPWAYLPDLARTFVAAAQKQQALGFSEVLHFAGHHITGQQWLDVLTPIARQQGWVRPGGALKFSRLPWSVIQVGGWVMPSWGALAEMRYVWDTPHALANDKLCGLLGSEPHTALAQAARSALKELGIIGSASAGSHYATA